MSLWDTVLSSIKPLISEQVYTTWFLPIEFHLNENKHVVLSVPDKFFQEWFRDHYLKILQQAFFENTKEKCRFEFQIKSKKQALDSAHQTEAALQPRTHGYSSQWNSRFSFQSFIRGPSNEFAVAASKAVAEKPGERYNPLFIHGGVGLGKTHLLHAIGLYLQQSNPNLKVCYTTTEAFTNDIINGIRQKNMDDTRKKYRNNCDVLLIDDIQFLSRKRATQEEFFHTFNFLFESRKQIVITCDKYPKEIPDLEERISSRFQWGLVTDLQPPEFETRVAILLQKAKELGITLSQTICEALAETIVGSGRELEGSLVKLSALSSLHGASLSLETIHQYFLPPQSAQNVSSYSIENVQRFVAKFYNVKVDELKGPRRNKSIIIPRQFAMFLCRKYTKESLQSIGLQFGGKDHSTVINAIKKIEDSFQNNQLLRNQLRTIEQVFIKEAAFS